MNFDKERKGNDQSPRSKKDLFKVRVKKKNGCVGMEKASGEGKIKGW